MAAAGPLKQNRHSGARVLRQIDHVNFVAEQVSPESITTIVSMDSGPAPQVGYYRPKGASRNDGGGLMAMDTLSS
jgi:hypothetical protein